jgi:hypothetical protein
MKYLFKTVAVTPEEALADGMDISEAHDGLDPAELHDDDEEPDTQIEHFDRHRALASERRWRRYALLGTHGCQKVWQRIYRLRPPSNDDQDATECMIGEFDALNAQRAAWNAMPVNARAAWQAMQDRDWATALIEIGAFKPRVLQLANDAIPARPRLHLTYIERENCYGETNYVPDMITVEGGDWAIPVKTQKWSIEIAQAAGLDHQAQQAEHDAELEGDFDRVDADVNVAGDLVAQLETTENSEIRGGVGLADSDPSSKEAQPSGSPLKLSESGFFKMDDDWIVETTVEQVQAARQKRPKDSWEATIWRLQQTQPTNIDRFAP